MKRKLQMYDHLSGNSKVDKAAFWLLFAGLLGASAGIIFTTYLIFH